MAAGLGGVGILSAPGPVLLFAFEPFGSWAVNSTDAVTSEAADRLRADGLEVARRVLPVTLEGAPTQVQEALDEHRPAAVVATGLAGRCHDVNVERVALNVADFRIPDNAGAQPRGGSLVENDPDAWITPIDLHGLVEAIEAVGAGARISNSAGTYLCNAVYFHVLRGTRPGGVPSVFLHMPPLPGAAPAAAEQDPKLADPTAEMPLEQQVAAVAATARFLVGGADR